MSKLWPDDVFIFSVSRAVVVTALALAQGTLAAAFVIYTN